MNGTEYPATYIGGTATCTVVVCMEDHNRVLEGRAREPGECHPPLPDGIEVIEW
jgi:hypothetical protein